MKITFDQIYTLVASLFQWWLNIIKWISDCQSLFYSIQRYEVLVQQYNSYSHNLTYCCGKGLYLNEVRVKVDVS